nr:divalent metal cation transporter [uncultured Desulfobulbus sp.]
MNNLYISYIKEMGPAWIISAVACGPATLASVAIAGATYGYSLLWVVLLSAIFGTTAQYLAARAGILEGKGVIAATEQHLGKTWTPTPPMPGTGSPVASPWPASTPYRPWGWHLACTALQSSS